MSLVVRRGWTDPIPFQLKQGGAAFNMSGYSAPVLDVLDAASQVVTWQGTVEFVAAATGDVRFLPHANDLVAGDYYICFRVTSPASKVSFFPRGDRLLVRVLP